MSLYPVFLKLENRRCVVIGGGTVAERKVKALVDAEGHVTVIAPGLTKELEKLRSNGRIDYQKRNYRDGDLAGCFLAIASTSSSEVNKKIYAEAMKRGIIINAVDDPENSNFFVPSSIRRGKFHIALSTSGTVPYFAKKLRIFLEQRFYKEMDKDLDILVELRQKIIRESENNWKRKDRLFEQLLLPKIEEILNKIERK